MKKTIYAICFASAIFAAQGFNANRGSAPQNPQDIIDYMEEKICTALLCMFSAAADTSRTLDKASL